MGIYVAMLRGINVGGKGLLKMDALRLLVTGLGHSDVSTYIQSGNVVFASRKGTAATIADGIEARIKKDLGMQVTVIVRSGAELAEIVQKNPFLPGADPVTLYVIFLASPPERAALTRLDAKQVAPDEFRVAGREVYARYPNGYGRSKMTNSFFENRLRLRGTARNWTTVTRLAELAGNAKAKK